MVPLRHTCRDPKSLWCTFKHSATFGREQNKKLFTSQKILFVGYQGMLLYLCNIMGLRRAPRNLISNVFQSGTSPSHRNYVWRRCYPFLYPSNFKPFFQRVTTQRRCYYILLSMNVQSTYKASEHCTDLP